MKDIKDDAFHLGSPFFVGRNKLLTFKFLKSKEENRLEKWRGKLLSYARRVTLIKSVLSAILSYVMSFVKVLVTLCHQLDGILRKFLWLGQQNCSRLHMVPWSVICNSKSEAGLGIRIFQDSNMALPCKVGWALASQGC